METATALAMRRSQRVKLETTVLVTSLLAETDCSERTKSFVAASQLGDTAFFSEICKTFVVNAQGCGVICNRPLAEGTPVRMELQGSQRSVTGRILNCHPINGNSYAVGVQMDVEGNFWGLPTPPPDWPKGSYEEKTEKGGKEAAAKPKPAAAEPAAAKPESGSRPAGKMSFWPSLSGGKPAGASAPAVFPPTVEVAQDNIPAEPTGLKNLREQARAVSQEFESRYRNSLNNLLARMRVALQTSASQLEGKLTMLREESAQVDAQLNSLRQLREDVLGQREKITAGMREQVEQVQQEMLAATRQQVQALLAEVTQHSSQLRQLNADIAAAGSGKLEQIFQSRDYIESLIRLAPNTIETTVQQAAAQAAEGVRARTQEMVAAQLGEEQQKLRQSLESAAERVEDQLRERLSQQFEQREHDLMDLVELRMEEMRAAESNFRDTGVQLAAEQARRQEQAVSELWNKTSELLAKREQEIIASSDQQMARVQQQMSVLVRELPAALQQQIQARAEELISAGLQNQMERVGQAHVEQLRARLDGQIAAEIEKRVKQAAQAAADSARLQLEATFEDRSQQLEEAHASARRQLETLQQAADSLYTQVESAIQDKVDQTVKEAAGRALHELQNGLSELQSSGLAQAQARLEQTFAGLMERAQASAVTLQQTLNSVQQENQRAQQQNDSARQQIEGAKCWLEGEKKKFETLVHETFLQASGEIRGRINLAMEMLQQPLERRAQEIQRQLQELGASQTAQFSQNAEQLQQRLLALGTATQQVVDERLSAGISESVEAFRRRVETLADTFIARWQASLAQTLESNAQILRANLAPGSEK